MGGRGSSSASKSGGLTLRDGTKYDFNGTLKYGDKDKSISDGARKALESWEARRIKNRIEYAYAVGPDGKEIWGEVRGSKGSVRTPSIMQDIPGSIFTHIHPRANEFDNTLGGTFSEADLRSFGRHVNNKTMRAVAKEGTYSITKGKNFKGRDFLDFVDGADKRFRAKTEEINNKNKDSYKKNEISYRDYVRNSTKAFNTALVQWHNELKSNAKKYGYTYTLERT